MRRVNQVYANPVVMTEQQRDMPGEGITTGYYLRIGHATANIGKCRQQYASVNAAALVLLGAWGCAFAYGLAARPLRTLEPQSASVNAGGVR